MPFALIFAGLILVVVGFRGEQDRFHAILKDDFTGDANYVYWMAAVFALGALGTSKTLKGFSDAMLGLLIIGMLVSNRGFFAKLEEQIK